MMRRKMKIEETESSVETGNSDQLPGGAIYERLYVSLLEAKEEIDRSMFLHRQRERELKQSADFMPTSYKFISKIWEAPHKLTEKPSSGLDGPKRKKKKMYNMPLLEGFENSCPLHLPPHDAYLRDTIEDSHILLTKEYDSSAAELYFLESKKTYVLQDERWRNCSILGFDEDGWLIFLKEDGREMFYLQVSHWIPQDIPPLPVCLSPNKCVVLHNGWRAALRHDPRDLDNMIAMVGIGHFYKTNINTLLVLYTWPNETEKWFIRTISHFDMGNMDVAEGYISGPVVLYLNDFYICWVCNGSRLVVFTTSSVQEIVIPNFLGGNLPVSMVVRPSRPDHIYLYQHRGALHVPPLVVRVRLPDCQVHLLHHFPATFYMTDYGGGYTDSDGYDEEGELVQEIIVTEYGQPGILLTESHEEEEDESSNTQGDGTSDSHGRSDESSESDSSGDEESGESSNSEGPQMQNDGDEESGESSNSEGPQMQNDSDETETSNTEQNESSNSKDNGGAAYGNGSNYEDQTRSTSDRGEGPQMQNEETETSGIGQTESEESSNTEGSGGPAHENSSEDEHQTSNNSEGSEGHQSNNSNETEESTDDQDGNGGGLAEEDQDQEDDEDQEEVVEASRDLYFAHCGSHHIDNYYTVQGVGLWRQLKQCKNCRHSLAWFHT